MCGCLIHGHQTETFIWSKPEDFQSKSHLNLSFHVLFGFMSDLLLQDFAKLLLHFEFFDRSLKAYGPQGLFLGFTFIRGRQPAALKQNVHFLLWTWTLVYLGHRSSSLTLICAVSLILPLRDL